MANESHAATRAPRVTARAKEALARVDTLGTNPYLVDLIDGSLSLEAFRASQRQFYFAVEFFPRPMAALLAKIPDPSRRLDILHNVVEEHGDFEPGAFHQNTFKLFLESIGEDPGGIEDQGIWAEVRVFNLVLIGACVLDEVEVGAGCMGVIEHAFARISAAIGKSVVRNGWVSEEDLTHYKLHAEIDERHAEEFYRVLEPLWDDPVRRYYIEQGLDLGALVFDRLYRGLYSRIT